MKRWHAETVSGEVRGLEIALQRIENRGGTIMSVITNPGPYLAWTVVWYEYANDPAPRETRFTK